MGKLNFNHPITKGLVFDALFAEGKGVSKTKELVNNLDGSIAASGATWDRNFFGTDLDFSASASRVQFTTPASVNSLTMLSVESLFYFRSLGGGSLGRLINKGPGTGTATPWFIFTDTGNFLTFSSGYATQTDNYRGATALITNTWYHAVFTITMGIGNSPTFYLNGVNTSLSRTATGSGAAATDDTNLYVGNRADSSRALDGKIAYARVWNRLLTVNEILQLYTNPWQIYVKPNFTPYYTSNPVVASTINLGTYRLLMGMGT